MTHQLGKLKIQSIPGFNPAQIRCHKSLSALEFQPDNPFNPVAQGCPNLGRLDPLITTRTLDFPSSNQLPACLRDDSLVVRSVRYPTDRTGDLLLEYRVMKNTKEFYLWVFVFCWGVSGSTVTEIFQKMSKRVSNVIT